MSEEIRVLQIEDSPLVVELTRTMLAEAKASLVAIDANNKVNRSVTVKCVFQCFFQTHP